MVACLSGSSFPLQTTSSVIGVGCDKLARATRQVLDGRALVLVMFGEKDQFESLLHQLIRATN